MVFDKRRNSELVPKNNAPHYCLNKPIREVVRVVHANGGRVVQTATDEQRRYDFPLAGADWTLRVRTVKGIVERVSE